MKKNDRSKNHLLKWILGFFLLILAGGLVFVYAVLPEKIAQTIMASSRVHKPLTQNPGQYGLAYRDVTFSDQDGIALSGWWIPSLSKKPLGTMILTHGVFKNREQMLSRANFLARGGYQALLFDLRGEGLSGESALSGGLLESKDYLAAADFLRKEKQLQKPVILFGFSMGAICALRAAAMDPDVQGVIADSPLANIHSYVSRRTAGKFFSFLPGFLSQCLSAYDRLSGLSLTEQDLDLALVVAKINGVPVLYITGEKDDLARPEEVRELFEKTPVRQKRLIYIQDAGHEETYSKFPKIYERIVSEFLNDLRAGFPEPKDALLTPRGYSTHPIK